MNVNNLCWKKRVNQVVRTYALGKINWGVTAVGVLSLRANAIKISFYTFRKIFGRIGWFHF
jgi:hypothetical protein